MLGYIEANDDREKLTAYKYNLARGPSYSLNENLVPEQLFDNPNTPEKEADGISAVKALSLAAHFGHSPMSCVAKTVSQTVY